MTVQQNSWLIRNATLVNEGRNWVADVRVRDGRIHCIGESLDQFPGEELIDATGLWLLPGMIDDQVHFREPGLTHKADIASESRACAAGGITSFMEMPNTKPAALDRTTLEAKYAIAAESSVVNYAFYMGASNDNLEAIREIDPASTPGLKVFMGASTGNMLVDNPEVLNEIFRVSPVPIITHCEDTPMINAELEKAKARFGDEIPARAHPLIRSREACIKSTRLAIELARKHGTRLHVLHISTAEELELFEPGPIAGKRITAETCVHFLHFTDHDYDRLGFLIKCNPAIKSARDRDAIVKALAEGRLDVLATDHAPHLLEEKQGNYSQAPSGIPLVQYALQTALERVFQGELTLERLVEVVSHAPAELFRVSRRGYLREGYAADLVLVDPQRPHYVTNDEVLSKCGWTPFDQTAFSSSIIATFVNGARVWDGNAVDGSVRGQRLSFTPHIDRT
ncbi:dihydroorotase [Pseudomonas auratipiscis]|uniref:Dihydroorotase n=1 Tax=Pseudomonas auratipiscis TaxID=3115853 RepID=A0AB35WV41_9PSED|nr:MULTISPECIES: dihydroorotase [unclassified Pseudomonas]MEE1866991.1 dihydroorotase [Pseudomonas sp. 120P]MEE1957818.1 dihydroorotase [Pseudomonas sp. 119P]